MSARVFTCPANVTERVRMSNASMPSAFKPAPPMLMSPPLTLNPFNTSPLITGTPVVMVTRGKFRNPHPAQVIPFGLARM